MTSWRDACDVVLDRVDRDHATPPPAGSARSPRTQIGELIRVQDPPPRAAHLLEQSFEFLGDEPIPASRYTSQQFADLEFEHMWPKVWQMACHAYDIPVVGDSIVYEIGDLSAIVVRTAPDEIRAYQNVCLHRHRQLREDDGYVSELRCPYHGFSWNLDGTLKRFPAPWDFPHVDPDDWCLPRVELGVWQDWVFVNFDPDAQPLDQYIGVLDHHFDAWPLDERYIAVRADKRVDCNWKAVNDAFLETLHVSTTHPEILATTGEQETQFDIYPPNVSRMLIPVLVEGSRVRKSLTDAELVAQAARRRGQSPELRDVEVAVGDSARDEVVAMKRQQLGEASGRDFSAFSDTELLDAIQYYLFPNFYPWGGYGTPIVYRFRPDGHRPDSAIMEAMLMAPCPAGGERPPNSPIRHLGEDETFSDVEEMATLGPVLDQDVSNMPAVHRGMKSAARAGIGITLGNYQESRIRHMHQRIDEFIDG